MKKITAVLAIGICLVVFAAAGPARATDVLEVAEFQVTFDTNGHSTPIIGHDSIGDLIVYSQYPVVNGVAGNASLYYQRLANGAPTGAPVTVADSPENQWLPDVSGDYIVYTMSPAVNQLGNIELYQISTSQSRPLTVAGENITQGTLNGNWSPKIYGNYVVWVQYIQTHRWIPRNYGLTPNTASPYAITVNALAISPGYASDHTLFAATSSGVFKSTDVGGDWTAVSPPGYGGAYHLVLSPGYASDHTLFAEFGLWPWFYKSTDGGATWTHASSGLGYVPGVNLTSVALSPGYASDQTLFAGMAGSGNAPPPGGVFKSTNGGATWTAVNSGLPGGQVSSVALSPGYASDQTLFAGTFDNGLYKSTNGGATWTAVNSGLTNQGVISVALSPGYASDQTLFAGTYGGGVFKSTNGGATWTGSSLPVPYGGGQVRTVNLSPGYASDQTLFAGTFDNGLYKSTDGGATWTNVNYGLMTSQNGYLGQGVDITSVALSPGYASDHTLFAGTFDRGVFLSETGGVTSDGTELAFLNISSGYPYFSVLMAGPIPQVEEGAVGDRFIVWSQIVNNQVDLAAYDMQTGLSFMVANDPALNETTPSTEGAWIVFETESVSAPNGVAIKAKNIDTGEIRTIVDNGAFNGRPTISGNLISYESYTPTTAQIYVYRIQQGDTFQVTSGTYNEHLNNLKGNLVTYVDNRNGNDGVFVSTLTFVSETPVNGACGSSNGSNLLTAPTTNLCGTGSASAVSGSGPWNWTCTGSNGGTNANCSANLTVNGACGSSNGNNFLTAPTTNLCDQGSASAVSGSGPWNWTCTGSNGGTNASCSANLTVNGTCGSSNGNNFLTAPTTNLCDQGSASGVSGSGPWSWTCTGSNGGTNANCSANLTVNGTCGSSNGNNFLTAPTTNLCNQGSASAVSGSGPWSWTCTGLYGGTNANCSANLTVNGTCGSSNGNNFLTAPTTNLCNQGSASGVSGSGPWNWTCTGLNGGTNANCSANLTVNGTCGSSNGNNFLTAPTTNLCNQGSASGVSGSGPWNWTCTGLNGGTNANCSANLTVNGTCGSSNGNNFLTAPTTNLCNQGSASGVSGSGPWNWTCTGLYGGTNANCSANLMDFSFSKVSPITATVGSPVPAATVTVNAINGFNLPVTLTVSGLPSGVSAAFSPVSVNPGGNAASSTLTVSLTPSVTPSMFTLQITGASGQLTHLISVTVTVTATSNGITSVIGQLLTSGCIDNSGIANALTSKLSQAQAAISAGQIKTAINILGAFINQVQAQNGKHIASTYTLGGVTFNPAAVLIKDVTALIDSLNVSMVANPMTGNVVDSNGSGVSGAAVSIVNSAGSVVATTTTDVTGFYFFATTGVLTMGSTYTVQVNASGFTTSTPASQTFTWGGTAITLSSFVLS